MIARLIERVARWIYDGPDDIPTGLHGRVTMNTIGEVK